MLCWLCHVMKPDRGGLCHKCRQAIQPDSTALRVDSRLMLGVVVAALLSLAAGIIPPTVGLLPPKPHPVSKIASRPRPPEAPVTYETVMVTEQVKRKVYPYSIVPGGAQNLHEARLAMSDPEVKAHYASFNLAQLKQVKLTTDIKGYVSYRWGDKIYWTAKTLTLRAGETVFTDGTHIARGRCLNCYSALPMLPIRPHEPTEKVLDVPVEMPMVVYSFPRLPVFAPVLPVPPGELTPTVPVIPAVAGTVAKGGGFWFPLIPIIPPIHHHPIS